MLQNTPISQWTVTQLVKFIKDVIDNYPPRQRPVVETDKLTVNDLLTIIDQVQFSQPTTTVGAAGSASAPPATPELYVKVLDPYGTVRVIPLYRTS